MFGKHPMSFGDEFRLGNERSFFGQATK